MTLAKYMVLTAEPDGTNPRFKFFPTEESAYEHARIMCKDLNRDAYVTEVLHKFHADRSKWNQEKKATPHT